MDSPEAEVEQLAQLRRAVAEDPRNGELRYLLGTLMAQQRDYDGAVLELSAALALSPHMHVARFQLGLLHLTLAQPQHTMAVLAPLENLDESNALRHFKTGIDLMMCDEYAACVAAFRTGVTLNQDNPALNRDIELIIERVNAVLRASETAKSSNETAEAVRTDFSLYGVTRH